VNTRGIIVLIALLSAAAARAQDAEPAMARIVTGQARVTQCISPIHVTQLDGEERQLPPLGFDLEPGVHSMHGTARIDLAYCQVRRETQPTSVPPLEAMFEVGKTYYIGLDHSAADRAEWRIVVWKVEDAEGQIVLAPGTPE